MTSTAKSFATRELRTNLTSTEDRQGGHVAEMQMRRLLLATTELVGDHGLQGAGVGRICKRAGVSRRTFYDLFDDGEACFLATFEHAVERVTQRVAPAFSCEGRWHERIRSSLTTLLGYFDEEPGLARLCLVETLKAGHAVLERRRQALDALIFAVDEGRLEVRGATEPSPLTAESVVGGAIAVIHARLIERSARPLVELVNPLTSMIVNPYLGPGASRRELHRSAPVIAQVSPSDRRRLDAQQDPFKDLPIRITFRTARVLATIAAEPGASNREIGQAAGVSDQGQMSKLLRRLERSGLINNHGNGQAKGEPNAWQLTERGQSVLRAVTV